MTEPVETLTTEDTLEEVAAKEMFSTRALLKFLLWLVGVLILLSIGNFLRSYVVQDAADKSTDAATRVEITSVEGRDAAVGTLNELRAIVARSEANSQSQPALSNQQVIDALIAIARIEGFLCGGPCPTTPPP